MKRNLAFFLIAPTMLCAQTPGDHWVATWTAAQQTPRTIQNQAPPASAANDFHHQTVRMIARTSIGGRTLRLELSNTYGTEALDIGAAHVAIQSKDSGIVPASDRELKVNGKTSFRIPPAALVLTDPVNLDFPALANLAISVYIPGSAQPRTQHSLGLHTTYISADGNFTGAQDFASPKTSLVYYWLSGIQVEAPTATSAIVAFGDSITDGFHSTPELNAMWPAVLAPRLGPRLAIVNEAISGNQLMKDGAGINALARFDHDVLSVPGAKWMIILEGINDIGRGLGRTAGPEMAITADDVIGAHRQIIERAHAHGIKVAGATLTPYEGAAYASDKGELVRDAVNTWIRTSHAHDAVIDFDALTRDPSHPTRFRPEFDSGDHLHPNDAGYKAMADAIDVAIFRQ